MHVLLQNICRIHIYKYGCKVCMHSHDFRSRAGLSSMLGTSILDKTDEKLILHSFIMTVDRSLL